MITYVYTVLEYSGIPGVTIAYPSLEYLNTQFALL